MNEKIEGRRSRLDFFARQMSRAIQQEGCPICRKCNEYQGKDWFWFFSESYGDGVDVGKYKDYWGFCKEHSKLIARIGPKWQKSVIYQWIIKAHLPELEKLQRRLQKLERAHRIISRTMTRRSVRKTVRKILPRGNCLFCESSRERAHHFIWDLLEALSDPEIRRLYEDSDGLCMQHFFLAVGDADFRHAPQLNELVKKQIRGLQELMNDFNEFFRKSEYHFSNEPKGKEQTTWIRAMSKLVGHADLEETDETTDKRNSK